VTVGEATAADVDAIHELIEAHVAEGHLLPRTRDEIATHARRFILATGGARILGCADVAPLSPAVAEVRSLVISDDARGSGIGRRLIDQLIVRAAATGAATLCAFTSAPGFFVQMGFSIVPHTWLPDKIVADCRACARFRSCRQYALMLSLRPTCHR
jgi:N-acetylglutamate synthase-like GNAT family acetyltransferase